MKTKILFIVTGILLFAGNNLYGQDYYMYVGKKKHRYKVAPNKMFVRQFESNVDSSKIKNSLQKMSVKTRKTRSAFRQ